MGVDPYYLTLRQKSGLSPRVVLAGRHKHGMGLWVVSSLCLRWQCRIVGWLPKYCFQISFKEGTEILSRVVDVIDALKRAAWSQ